MNLHVVIAIHIADIYCQRIRPLCGVDYTCSLAFIMIPVTVPVNRRIVSLCKWTFL